MVIAFDENRFDFLNLIGKATENSGTVIYSWPLTANHAHRLARIGLAGVPTVIRNMLMTWYRPTTDIIEPWEGHPLH